MTATPITPEPALPTPALPSTALPVETVPSLLQATGALLLVLGLIALVAWLFKRFAFNGQLLTRLPTRQQKKLQLAESLWLDARYRVVVLHDGTTRHTILLGPQQALQLGTKTAECSGDASSTKSSHTP